MKTHAFSELTYAMSVLEADLIIFRMHIHIEKIGNLGKNTLFLSLEVICDKLLGNQIKLSH